MVRVTCSIENGTNMEQTEQKNGTTLEDNRKLNRIKGKLEIKKHKGMNKRTAKGREGIR
jgi:hypothetical protein